MPGIRFRGPGGVPGGGAPGAGGSRGHGLHGIPMSRSELYGTRIQDLLLKPAVWIVLAVLVGLFLGTLGGGMHYGRFVKIVAAAIYVLVALRYPLFVGVGLFFIIYPYPAVIKFGSTNFIILIFLTALWVVRMALRREPRARRTPLDWAIVAYIAVHVFSLIHVENTWHLEKCLLALRNLMTPILLYYVVMNVARSRQRLLFLVEMFTISMMVVYFSSVMQRHFPGIVWLPQAFLAPIGGKGLFTEVVTGRVGGIFTHALLGDSTAVMVILQIYLAIYYRQRPWMRAYHWFLAVASIYVLGLTGNRGGLMGFFLGLTYFLWLFSGEFSWRRFAIGATVIVGLFVLEEAILTHYAKNTLLTRMFATRLEGGIPETRRHVWTYIWDRILENPVFGHGPYFEIGTYLKGERAAWPHNAYIYYVYTIGLVGLPAYLYLAGRVLQRTWVGRGFSVGDIPVERGLSAMFHIAAVQFLFGQLRTDHQRGDVFIYFMWIIFSLGLLAREVWDQQKSAPKVRSRLAGGR
ncbi:MAG: O-antigen ligase family protein [Candidatus Eisenbacteria sp.]|nr:O-antigen ligase family protein [Candidatus Eisenbacteria bacterium]